MNTVIESSSSTSEHSSTERSALIDTANQSHPVNHNHIKWNDPNHAMIDDRVVISRNDDGCCGYHTFVDRCHDGTEEDDSPSPLPNPPLPLSPPPSAIKTLEYHLDYYHYYHHQNNSKLSSSLQRNIFAPFGSCGLRFIILLLFVLLVSVLLHGGRILLQFPNIPKDESYMFHNVNDDKNNHHPNHGIVDWRWDHNTYFHHDSADTETIPTTTSHHSYDTDEEKERTFPTTNSHVVVATDRILLMAQLDAPEDSTDEFTKTSNRRRRSRHGKRSSSTQQQVEDEDMSFVFSNLDEITSRPNRAYARQWNRNYVRVPLRSSSVSSTHHHHHDKNDDKNQQYHADMVYTISHFLKVIRDEQQQLEELRIQELRDNTTTTTVVSPQYSVVAILLPGSIILDLDYDLLQLIPTSTLISISGDSSRTRNNNDNTTTRNQEIIPSGILFVNLQHSNANAFIDLWWDIAQSRPPPLTPMEEDSVTTTTTTTINGGSLWRLTQSLLVKINEQNNNSGNMNGNNNNNNNDASTLLHLEEATGGFVVERPYHSTGRNTETQLNNSTIIVNVDDDYMHLYDRSSSPANHNYDYCIKSFSWTSSSGSFHESWMDANPGSDEDDDVAITTKSVLSILTTLQTIADAVCYRYYPKCEIM